MLLIRPRLCHRCRQHVFVRQSIYQAVYGSYQEKERVFCTIDQWDYVMPDRSITSGCCFRARGRVTAARRWQRFSHASLHRCYTNQLEASHDDSQILSDLRDRAGIGIDCWTGLLASKRSWRIRKEESCRRKRPSYPAGGGKGLSRSILRLMMIID
jgi:hypothetical protein